DPVLEDVTPCSPEDGWCWVVTTWVDGVIVDVRAVLVPDTVDTLDYEDLEQVDPRTLDPANINMDAWRFLLQEIRDDLATIPDGAHRVEDSNEMVFTRDGVPVLTPVEMPSGPRGLPGVNAVP